MLVSGILATLLTNYKSLALREAENTEISSLQCRTPAGAVRFEPGTIILDLRPPLTFASAFVPGSYSTSDERCLRLALSMMGTKTAAIHTVGGNTDQMHRAETLFLAAGFSVRHFEEMNFGSEFSEPEIAKIEIIEPEQLAVRILGWKTTVLDLRDAAEFKSAHTRDALNLPVESLDSAVFGLPFASPLTVVSNSAALSAFGASVLFRQGFQQIAILRDGFAHYKDRGLPCAPK